MKLLGIPEYNVNVKKSQDSSQGIWKIDDYPLYVCRPASGSADGLVIRKPYWVVVPDSKKPDWLTISSWLKVHKLGLDYHYPLRARALDVLQMALLCDPQFFDN